MPTLQRGQNAKIIRSLFYSNGTTPLLLADLSDVFAEIVQYNKVVVSYILKPAPNPVDEHIEEGDAGNKVLAHLSQAVSATLREGPLYIRIKMRKADGTYYDTNQYDIDEHTPFSIII